MGIYLATIALVFAILLGGIAIDRLYRRFALRNPQLGPFRKEADGKCGCCASSASCADSSCRN